MTKKLQLFPVAGTHRPEPVHPNTKGKPVNGNKVVYVTLRVATKASKNPKRLEAYFTKRNKQVRLGHPVAPLTPAQYAARFGADKKDLAKVRRQMKKYDRIEFVRQAQYNGDLVYKGPVAAFREIAEFNLVNYTDKHGKHFMARIGEISLKDPILASLVTSVRGLDTRKQGHTHARPALDEQGKPKKPHAVDNSWTVTDLAARFNVPVAMLQKLAKKNVTIGLVELGGGYTTSDNQQAAATMGVSEPQVGDVLVDGATNSPGDPNGADGEVALDIQALFMLGSNVKILVGQGPNSGSGFVDIIEALIDAGCDVISISWGMAQDNWSAADIAAMEAALARADALGIVVMVASGDTGSADSGQDGKSHVDYPSASAHATGAGGLFVPKTGTITVWNDDPTSSATGGGVATNAVPSFQAALQAAGKLPKNADTGAAGRCVPDLSADADPNSGVVILVDGQWMVIGGTSFAAPFIAAGLGAIICLIGKRLVGFNTYIYQFGYTDGFIIDVLPPGNNGAYNVLEGYDCCTGLGYMDFTKFLTSLQNRGFAA